tara:strand:- start:215298 stop:215507 length:210 start_codon:yes stop_codon:yes gene_type:complete
MLNGALNILSVVSTFIVIESIFYVVLNLLFGRFAALNKYLFDGVRYKDVAFLLIGALFVLFFFKFHLPR